MIPFTYRLSAAAKLELTSDGEWRVVSKSPLNVLAVNAAAARLLERARDGASVSDIAAALASPEEKIFGLCEHLRRRGVLEMGRPIVDPTFAPSVSVIVPTRDRAGDLDECLQSLSRLEYPSDLVEVMVIDDGSEDTAAVAEVADRHHVRFLVNAQNRGPSYSRNRAAREAAGELLAFIDSDCVAGASWLCRLVPYFAWHRVGAVGGRTVGYHAESRLDRYEEVHSPLDMGRHVRLGLRGSDTFYVPTCNLLVRRSLYRDMGGLREDLLVGEDVDLCWRLRARGACLVYTPEGVIRHKHRDRLVPMLLRRARYGSSEARLHALHPDKRKSFPLSLGPLTTVALLSAALVGREPRLLPAGLVPMLCDGGRRMMNLQRHGVGLPARSVWSSVLRSHLTMLYFVYFHLVRYYLGPLVAAGPVVRGAWLLAGSALVCSSAVDYHTRRPRLGYLTYLGYYVAEHVAYQTGVVAGCLAAGTFRSYLPVFRRESARGLLGR